MSAHRTEIYSTGGIFREWRCTCGCVSPTALLGDEAAAASAAEHESWGNRYRPNDPQVIELRGGSR